MLRHAALIYTVCHSLYQAALELPSIPIVFIALVIKLELFMLQLTCEKDVGMGLCMFNFVILLSLHLAFRYFHPYIFLHFLKMFFWTCSISIAEVRNWQAPVSSARLAQ